MALASGWPVWHHTAMPELNAAELFETGRAACERGNTLHALSLFEKASGMEDNPALFSWLGYCLARERGQVKRGISLCEEGLRRDPRDAGSYLNLGRIHLVAGRKAEAIAAFRSGLQVARSPALVRELERLGSRSEPPFRFVPRSHALNRVVGLVLARLGLR